VYSITEKDENIYNWHPFKMDNTVRVDSQPIKNPNSSAILIMGSYSKFLPSIVARLERGMKKKEEKETMINVTFDTIL
jgi:hypothetical protein